MDAPKAIFVTSNEDKRREVEKILGVPLDSASPNVPEIQSLDFAEVAAAKALAAHEALGNPPAPVMVDDSGLVIEAWNGFPGALTKWLMQSVGNEGLLRMLTTEEDRRARAVCVVAVVDENGETRVFRGEVAGEIVRESRGEGGFGYDPVFRPDGSSLTYAEMGENKGLDSHRTRAFRSLREWMDERKKRGVE